MSPSGEHLKTFTFVNDVHLVKLELLKNEYKE